MELSKINFPGLVVASCLLIIIGAVIYLAFQRKINPAKPRASKESSGNADEEYKSLMEKYEQNKPYGKTDRYEWTQTDNEAEVYIPCNADLVARMVKVEMKTYSLEVKLNNVVIIKGDFPHSIKPDDSCWVIDASNDGRKHIWITLFKASPGIWRHILNNDANSLPPVHAINPDDPSSIKKALQKVKEG